MTASILARDNKMPMWVFGLNEENSIVNTCEGQVQRNQGNRIISENKNGKAQSAEERKTMDARVQVYE